MGSFNAKILSAAQKYINLGWAVFPVHSIEDGKCTCGNEKCADAGKHPRVPRGSKQASKDPEQIKKWFGEGAPKSNIAIVTGDISGITVLDIDIGDGKLGAESWQAAISEHGEPQTLMSQTGSGGMHAIFGYNSAVKTATNVLGDGIDSRSDGGYIVAPPSLHRSGGAYQWENWGAPTVALPSYLLPVKKQKARKEKFKVKYTLDVMVDILEYVPSEDRDNWRNVGIILGREYLRSDNAWRLYQNWSEKANCEKSRNHDRIMQEAFYELSQKHASGKGLTVGTIIKLATDNGWAPETGDTPIGNFVFYAPANNFIYTPTQDEWVAGAVDALVSPVNDVGVIIKASQWIRTNKAATSMTKDPDIEERYLKGFDCKEGEVKPSPGGAVFNSYNKSSIKLGDATLANPFVEHVHLVFNKDGDAGQFLDYMAHRVQRAGEKPRFALIIAGMQGTGKDTAIEFCNEAIGIFNVSNIDPKVFETNYNDYAASTLVRVSEAASLKDISKWSLNEQMKVLIAGSPDYCRINPKYGKQYSVRMYCGVIITTNNLASGIYIPPDDRRYDVIECATMKEMGLEKLKVRNAYFEQLWEWFKDGGNTHVAAYLNERDISKFSAATGQRKTKAHGNVIMSGMRGDEWLGDILEEMGMPEMVRADTLISKAVAEGENKGRITNKLIHAMKRLGYEKMINETRTDGRYKIGKKPVTIYSKEGEKFSKEEVLKLKDNSF